MLGDQDATKNARVALDRLFQVDAILSMSTGLLGVAVPHAILVYFVVEYNHNVHEMVRLYASLRLAMGWMLWNVRRVDDGLLRRRICESLFASNILQSIVVLRAIFTTTTSESDESDTATTTTERSSSNNNNLYNWLIFILLTVLAFSYGQFRFGRNGNLIKIYELPTSGTLR